MKMKNVGFVEKHIEKMVFALAALFLLVIFWVYAIFPQRVEVQVGSAKEAMGPGRLRSEINDQAEKLRRNLNNAVPPEQLTQMHVPPYAQQLESVLHSQVTAQTRLPAPLGPPGLPAGFVGLGDNGAAPRYALPKVPAPADPAARGDFAVLAEMNDNLPLRAAWIKTAGLDAPGAFRYVSVGSSFDMEEWRRELRRMPEPRIPDDWWRSQTLVTQVQLERQELVHGAWSDPVTVPRLPTQAVYQTDQSQLPSSGYNDLLLRLRARQPRVLRPRLEPLTDERTWFPPTVDSDMLLPTVREQARVVLQTMRTLSDQIETTQATNIPGVMTDEDGLSAQAGANASGAMEGGGFDPSGGGYDAGVSPADMGMDMTGGGMTTTVTTDATLGLEQQYTDLQTKFQAVIDGKLDLSKPAAATPTPVAPGAGRTSGVAAPLSRRPSGPNANRPGAAAPPPAKLPIMVHDVTVKPGRTYRYRLVVWVYNPLFRKGAVEAAQRAKMFDKLALASAPSAWSEPVAIPPEKQYFLVGASVAQETSTWEIWRIYRGQWVKWQVQVHLGDPIGDDNAQVDVLPPLLPGQLPPPGVTPTPQQVVMDMAVPEALVDVQAVESTLGNTQRTILLQTEDGALSDRLVLLDRDNKARDRLLRSIARPYVARPSAPPDNNNPDMMNTEEVPTDENGNPLGGGFARPQPRRQ